MLAAQFLKMKKFILATFDLNYLLRFILLFLVLYYSNLFYLGIVTPGNYYNAFLNEHFNYFNWIKWMVLHLSSALGMIFGIHTGVYGTEVLRSANGSWVTMGWPCIGFGVMSFWIAFIFAQDQRLKKKIYWCLGGLVSICLINSVRILLVLVGLDKKWQVFQRMDNHTFFNIAAYVLVFILIFLYDKNNKEPKEGMAVFYSAS